MDKSNDDGSVSSASSTSSSKKEAPPPKASFFDLLSFLEDLRFKILFFLGCVFATGNGMVYPAMAFIFAEAFSDLASLSIDRVREVSLTFVALGSIAFALQTLQNTSFEICSQVATRNFRLQWFHALLRQDIAYFDVYKVSALATTIGPSSQKIQRGLGKKFGEGIQFSVTAIGGLVYSFTASWKVTLVILAVFPLVSISATLLMQLNQRQTSEATKSYAQAGSVAYETVANIRTVLAMGAMDKMIQRYKEATLGAYNSSVRPLIKIGLVNGSMLGSFLCLYLILTIYGTSILANAFSKTGCDPSGANPMVETCPHGSTAGDVFSAMLGIAFAGQGMSQVANFLEALGNALTAAYPALQAINRVVGSQLGEAIEVEMVQKNSGGDDDASSTAASQHGSQADEESAIVPKAILPRYTIDSSSPKGLKPDFTEGMISLNNVSFAYPTRPNAPIFSDLSLTVEPNTTLAIVGESGGGKSTVISLVERYYDPSSGSIEIDGVKLTDINVTHLRDQIGLVSQEPTLFATTIAGNISYGSPTATEEDIIQAAKMANAHEFITSFPDGYGTFVGDKGAQLSGGQKQRIAIARVLVKNPKILLLDEATSALDSESELIVQEALDKLLSGGKRTTIVIAHRLSTIRQADKIAVIMGGKVVELGSHDALMKESSGHYRKLVEKQSVQGNAGTSTTSQKSAPKSSSTSFLCMDQNIMTTESIEMGIGNSLLADNVQMKFENVTFAYPTRPTKTILDEFNLEIRKGETLALVGPSGGGKSTLFSLIERFYDPSKGSVFFEGTDIRELNVKSLRDHIGYVAQEPSLFNDTIGNNITYGCPGATMEDIVYAAKQANAHDFISTFPAGYDTPVGERGTQLSGGQKQRIAIARSLIKKPKILMLDEATSALDSNSEAVVQEALDDLMGSKDMTIIVIAHRLSTVRNADRIAVIGGGKVRELGEHKELMNLPSGRYRRLVDAQTLGKELDLKTIKSMLASDKKDTKEGEHDSDDDIEQDKSIKGIDEDELAMIEKYSNGKKARQMAYEDWKYIVIGAIGALLSGGVFPAWGVMFGLLIDLLFYVAPSCDESTLSGEYDSCDEFFAAEADDMRQRSYISSVYWTIIILCCLFGNVFVFVGFGKASESLNKRIRDMAFSSLCRQEITFFDKKTVGSITSQLQDDAAKIHAFSGQPIRIFLVNVSSLVCGLVISFIYCWPMAALSLAVIPVMGFATSIDMKLMLGEDEIASGDDAASNIIVESLVNIRTISSMCLEDKKYTEYKEKVAEKDGQIFSSSMKTGVTSGLSPLIQLYVNALQFFWGGWLIITYPNAYSFQDFLISMFALIFALFAFGASSIGAIEKKLAGEASGRIFYLINRESAIDSMSLLAGKKVS